MSQAGDTWVYDALPIDEFDEVELPDALCMGAPGSSLSSSDGGATNAIVPQSITNLGIVSDTPSTSRKSSVKLQSEEEAKRMRNRASVEKCRRKKRQRLESLTSERAALTRENVLLKEVMVETRAAMIQILHEVANLSGAAVIVRADEQSKEG